MSSQPFDKAFNEASKVYKDEHDRILKMTGEYEDLEVENVLLRAQSPSASSASLSSIGHITHAAGSIQITTSTTETIDSSNEIPEITTREEEQPFSDAEARHIEPPSMNQTPPSTAASQPPHSPPSQSSPPQPSPPLFAITDLVNEEDEILPTAPTLDLTSLRTSKHDPDFRIRNHHKVLKLAAILSDLNLHLSAAHRAQDQAAFNAMYARITAAGEGLGTLAQAMPAEKRDGVRRLGGGELCEVNRTIKEGEWYHVQHGGDAEEGGEHDGSCLRRLERAREGYEARLDTGPDSSEVGAEEDDGEWQDESRETTLVEGEEWVAMLRPMMEVALD